MSHLSEDGPGPAAVAAGKFSIPRDTMIHPMPSALVLAAFGTTVEPALADILAVQAAMTAAFPAVPVHLAFTSNQVRHVWQRRAADPDYAAAHPEVPEELLSIRGVLAAVADLQDQGHKDLLIQSLHLVPAEEFHDLSALAGALASIRTMKPRWRPFDRIRLGRPLLGAYNPRHPYRDDVRACASALAGDAGQARDLNAALVYMGHGNPYFPAGGLYLELAAHMRRLYPEVPILAGTVEGFPDLEEIEWALRAQGARRVLLRPFLLVAGEHALRDLAGPDEDSWRSRLERAGFEVFVDTSGLGRKPEIARLFVEHALQAAAGDGPEIA